jgi:hypothetical protein
MAENMGRKVSWRPLTINELNKQKRGETLIVIGGPGFAIRGGLLLEWSSRWVQFGYGGDSEFVQYGDGRTLFCMFVNYPETHFGIADAKLPL